MRVIATRDTIRPDVAEASKAIEENLLPSKSEERYETMYNKFMEWRDNHKLKSLLQAVFLDYFVGKYIHVFNNFDRIKKQSNMHIFCESLSRLSKTHLSCRCWKNVMCVIREREESDFALREVLPSLRSGSKLHARRNRFLLSLVTQCTIPLLGEFLDRPKSKRCPLKILHFLLRFKSGNFLSA